MGVSTTALISRVPIEEYSETAGKRGVEVSIYVDLAQSRK